MKHKNPNILLFWWYYQYKVFWSKTNVNKYLTLVPTNESKEKIKKHEELWIKIKDLIRSVTENSDDYDENYTKIKFNSDDKLPLNKMIEFPTMIIVVKSCFSWK